MSLSREIGDRDFQSYTENVDGETCRRVQGIVGLSDADGITVSTRSASNTGRIFLSGLDIVLRKGTSIGIDYTPPTSNTSQTCQFIAALHVRHPEFVDINI